jgi:hypothetical protein
MAIRLRFEGLSVRVARIGGRSRARLAVSCFFAHQDKRRKFHNKNNST